MENSTLVGIFEQLLGVKTTKTITFTDTVMDVGDDFIESRFTLIAKNYRSCIHDGSKFYFIFDKIIVGKKAFLQGKIFSDGKAITNLLKFNVPLLKSVNIDFIVTKGYIYILVGSNLKAFISSVNYKRTSNISFLDGKKVYEHKLKACTKILKAGHDKVILQKKGNSVVVITSKLFNNSLDYILN